MTRVPVVQKVNDLLEQSIAFGASDIHLEPFQDGCRVRFRIDGVLKAIETLPLAQKDEFASRIKIMAQLDIAERRKPQDGKFHFSAGDRTIDVRVSVLPITHGEKIVLRLLDREKALWSIGQLGMQTRDAELFRRHIHLPYGMILVTGPTGSGKTTSLYSALSELNSEHRNITTIENPIEYELSGVNQSQVKPDIDYTFASALRSILRQDPDIIMVGEIRDRETANTAIQAALTGHLVLSTLHTNDAVSAVTRLVNMGVDRFLIASALKLVIAQRLARKNCEHCVTSYHPDANLLQEVGLSATSAEFRHGVGCEHCHNIGYSGRTGLFEVMPVDAEMGRLISSGADEPEILAFAEQAGFRKLAVAARELIKQGETTVEEMIRTVVFDPQKAI